MERTSPTPQDQDPNAEQLEQLNILRDREFLVGRNIDKETRQAEYFETGWIINDVSTLKDGRLVAVISVPEQNIAKRILVDELLSWQPDDVEEEDTLVHPHELDQRMEHIEEELGEAALEASDVPAVETEASHEEELSADDKAAEARILAVLGEDGKGENSLARVLREAGTDLTDIRSALADKKGHAELRDTVRTVLARRMSDLLAEGGHFHERVQRNSPGDRKVPEGNHGYEKRSYRSDEYVVLLALAKLDGSFETDKERNNYSDYAADHVHQGQHRQASDALLESFVAENEPTVQERETTDDIELLRVRDAIDDMLERFRTNNRLNYEQIDQIEDLLNYPTIDLDAIDEVTDVMVARLHETYETIHQVLDELYRAKDDIDEATLGGMKRRNVFDQAAVNIRQGMDVLSMEYAYQGIGMIDRLTSESRHDANMQLEYRARVSQLLQHLKDTQQTALSIMESTEL